jgi:shikimate kinase/shikimate kinase/3-dehydroquinate synthase
LAALVARKLKLNFIDVDKEIEKELGTSIAKTFEKKG